MGTTSCCAQLPLNERSQNRVRVRDGSEVAAAIVNYFYSTKHSQLLPNYEFFATQLIYSYSSPPNATTRVAVFGQPKLRETPYCTFQMTEKQLMKVK